MKMIDRTISLFSEVTGAQTITNLSSVTSMRTSAIEYACVIVWRLYNNVHSMHLVVGCKNNNNNKNAPIYCHKPRCDCCMSQVKRCTSICRLLQSAFHMRMWMKCERVNSLLLPLFGDVVSLHFYVSVMSRCTSTGPLRRTTTNHRLHVISTRNTQCTVHTSKLNLVLVFFFIVFIIVRSIHSMLWFLFLLQHGYRHFSSSLWSWSSPLLSLFRIVQFVFKWLDVVAGRRNAFRHEKLFNSNPSHSKDQMAFFVTKIINNPSDVPAHKRAYSIWK